MTNPPEAAEALVDVALLPCPFCGANNPFWGTTLDDGCYVVCGRDACLCLVGYTKTTAEAIAAWNTRAHTRNQPSREEIARLRKGKLCLEHHPATSGDHATGDIAREIVGHFHSKGDLVQVVTVLLRLAHPASKEERDHG